MNEENITITTLLEEISEAMCDEYCKYAAFNKINTDDELDEFQEKYCSNCPINSL